jgi:hypothetical protein
MRTSGTGGRDGLMTTVPLVMLLVFVVWMAGGPKSTVRWLESVLGSSFSWVGSFFR